MNKKLKRYTEEDLKRAFRTSNTAPVGAKGTKDNPYTQEEFEARVEAGTWGGGYVGDEYIPAIETLPGITVTPSGSTSTNENSDDWYCPRCGHPYPADAGADYVKCSNCGTSLNPKPTNPSKPGSGGGGGSTGGENPFPGGYIANVIPTEAFSPYQRPGDCLIRSNEMLNYAGVETGPKTSSIIMTETTTDGRAGEASSSFSEGINLINQTLESGKPIIVSVDYQTGNAGGANLAGGDHFVVIVGRQTSGNGQVQYRFYDPGTSYKDKGTSSINVFTLGDDNRLSGPTEYAHGRNYIVVTVRPNQK